MLTVTILDNEADAAALRDEWIRLREATGVWSVAQGPDYVLTAWAVISTQPGARLAVITARRDGELVAIWPLAVLRQGRVRVATHPGCGGNEEYAGPLITGNGPEAREIALRVLEAAKGVADVLRAYNIRRGTPMGEVLEADPTPRRQGSVGSPVTSLKGFASGDAWVQSLSKSLRSGLRYERRRLSAMGELKFLEMSGPEDGPRCVAWMFDQKRAWFAQNRVRDSWMLRPQGRELITRLAARPRGDRPLEGDMQVYALTLDGRIIAACFGFSSSDRFEYYNNAYDPEFAAYSPGNLLIEDTARLAVAAGLDYDFRITVEPYKKRWLDRFDPYDTYILACTPAGRIAVEIEKFQRRIRVFRAKWGPRIKGLLRRRASKTA